MQTNLIHSYKEFNGKSYPTNIFELFEERLMPQTVENFIEYATLALESKNKNENKFWFKNYRNFGTIDALAHHKDELIVIPKSKELINCNIKSEINKYGGIPIEKKIFQKYKEEYGLLNRKDILTGPLNKKQAIENLILAQLLGEGTLREYVDLRYSDNNENTRNISLHLPECQNEPAINAWSIGFLDEWTQFNSHLKLNDADWHLIGINEINLNQSLLSVLSLYGIKKPEQLDEIINSYQRNKK